MINKLKYKINIIKVRKLNIFSKLYLLINYKLRSLYFFRDLPGPRSLCRSGIKRRGMENARGDYMRNHLDRQGRDSESLTTSTVACTLDCSHCYSSTVLFIVLSNMSSNVHSCTVSYQDKGIEQNKWCASQKLITHGTSIQFKIKHRIDIAKWNANVAT